MENDKSKKFKILALDGGGIRGLYSAVILKKVQDALEIKLKDYFDLVIGTSTGSILASAIVCDIPLDRVIKLYEEKSKLIFKKSFFKLCGGLFRSKYSNKYLSEILHETFGDFKLGGIDKPLMIIASDIISGSVFIHKSNYLPKDEYVRDKETHVSDAILSSCSAPTFFNPVRLKNNLLADGGLWANNPSIFGLIEAITEKRFNKNIEDIKILSVGTGVSNIFYTQKAHRWGFITGWKREKLIEYILNLSSESSTNVCKLILKDNYLRINGCVSNYKMDDINGLDNLKTYAEKYFLNNRQKILDFINGYNSIPKNINKNTTI